MHISIKLSFNNKKTDINAIIDNIKSEFCDLYSSHEFEKKISIEQAKQNVLEQLEQTNHAELFASQNNTLFKVILDWNNNLIKIEPCNPKTAQDAAFYIYKALEVCNSFAIYEFLATQEN